MMGVFLVIVVSKAALQEQGVKSNQDHSCMEITHTSLFWWETLYVTSLPNLLNPCYRDRGARSEVGVGVGVELNANVYAVVI